MPPLVHLIQLHSPSLPFRQTFLDTTLKIFKEFAKERLKSRTLITTHEPTDLKPRYQEIEKTIDTTKIGEEEFDRHIQSLSLEQISNFYKQKEALQQVAKGNPNDLYIILEDDCIFLPEFQVNLFKFLEEPHLGTWDICLLSVSSNQKDFSLTNARSICTILPSKDAYAITPATAKELLPYLDKIYYHYRVQLSRWIVLHPDIKVLCPTARVSIEGSKVGFMPSSVVDNNLLVYNHEFMEMFKQMAGQAQVPLDLPKVKALYKTVEHLQSPEIMHLYGVILFKQGKKDQAKELFLDAVNQMQLKNGLITARSELLNNCINIHGMVQEDLEMHRRNESKYAKAFS
jgi:hypothetical protein